MKTVQQMLKQVQQVKLPQLAVKAVSKTLSELEQANRNQMLNGKNADETPISPAYKPTTIAIKRRKGQETRWVTLKDKGFFHRGIDADVSGDNYVIDSTDELSPFLKKKYGEKIFGVGGKYKEGYVEGPLADATFQELENQLK